jgi:hypothetical protein
MPATFVLNETIANEAEGQAIVVGYLTGVDTSSFSEGDVVYVGETGGYTNVKPTGTNLIQNLGVVIKSHETSGSGIVYGSGRTNDVPNLPEGKVFIGSSTNTTESPYTFPTSDGASGQVLLTDGSGALSFGTVADISGDTSLSSSITVSNQDDAFSHMVSPIAAGTPLESVLRAILERYYLTGLTLNTVRVAYQNTDGTYPETVYKSIIPRLELGRGIKSDGFTFSIGTPSQVAADSLDFTINGVPIISDGSLTPSTVSYTPYTLDPDTSATRYFTVKVTDEGSGEDIPVTSSKGVSWGYLYRLATATTNTIANDTAAQALYSTGLTDMGTAVSPGSAWETLTDSGSNNESNYTYIVIPAPQEIESIDANGVLPVLDAFTDLGNFNIVTQYGLTRSYRFYVSNQTAAFAENTSLTINT